MTSISLGNELKDQYKNTSKWIGNGAVWLEDVEGFYRERAVLEDEYSTKLKALTAKYFEKKSKVLAAVSVGDEPQVTPGSLECALLVLWTDLLTQTEAIATEKANFSRELNGKVCGNISTLKSKVLLIQRKIDLINELLVNDKKKLEESINKSKRTYDSLCKDTETAREKTEKLSNEKYAAKLKEKEVLMNNGKNDYLIAISIANRLKDKYYYQDIPELQDYLQELNELKVALLNKIFRNAGIIERNSVDKCKDKLHAIDTTIDQNTPQLDSAMFAKHNATSWLEPQDFVFVPCSFWHDDEQLVVKEPELTHLKKILNTSLTNHSQYEDRCIELKQLLEEAASERKMDPADITLKFDEGVFKLLGILEQFLKNDALRVQNEVTIETIQNFVGDKDMTYVAPEVKKKLHFGLFKHKRTDTETSDGALIHTSTSGSGSTTTHHTSALGLFNIRKRDTAQNIDPLTATNTGSEGNVSAKALYEYAAAGDDETSISAGDLLEVLEPDDGSGWILVASPRGGRGLVPSLYVEVIRKSAIPPPVAPKRGAKRVQYVEALYDYVADGVDELSISAGDRIVLVSDDDDGWTEGEINGKKGVFPTSYVKKV